MRLVKLATPKGLPVSVHHIMSDSFSVNGDYRLEPERSHVQASPVLANHVVKHRYCALDRWTHSLGFATWCMGGHDTLRCSLSLVSTHTPEAIYDR
jgi:hypothetical protein